MRVALLFMVLITTATYTANLVAFLTEPAWKVHGPKVRLFFNILCWDIDLQASDSDFTGFILM